MAGDEWLYGKEQIRAKIRKRARWLRVDDDIPQGGMAKWMYDDPQKWKPLGKLKWQCQLGSQVFRQDFERGAMIIGPFRLDPKQQEGAVFVLFPDDSKFNSGE
jgi:hypothetical protein